MVIQYRKKGSRWSDYHGKEWLDLSTDKYEWRLLSEDKSKVLWPARLGDKDHSSYEDVLKNMRRIEFFKHQKTRGSLATIFKPYSSGNKKGGQRYHKRKKSDYIEPEYLYLPAHIRGNDVEYEDDADFAYRNGEYNYEGD